MLVWVSRQDSLQYIILIAMVSRLALPLHFYHEKFYVFYPKEIVK